MNRYMSKISNYSFTWYKIKIHWYRLKMELQTNMERSQKANYYK